MTAADKALLLRVARRLEEQIEVEWANVIEGSPSAETVKTARRRRDRVLGEARDLKDLAARVAREEG